MLAGLISFFLSTMAFMGSSSGKSTKAVPAEAPPEKAQEKVDIADPPADPPQEEVNDAEDTQGDLQQKNDDTTTGENTDAAPVLRISGEDAVAGRVTTLTVADAENVASVRVLSDPADGNVTVNPDNTLALVLTTSQSTGDISFDYEVTYKDGSVQGFQNQHTVVEGSQDAGWGQGKFYMLETDENDDVIVETGAEHRPVYISGGEDALSRADIAILEGLDPSEITDKWLIEHPDYGGDPDTALDTDTGMAVWTTITSAGDKETSNWLLFEKGYEYEVGRLVGRGISGEDELHPLHITSYGEGGDAVIASKVTIYQEETENLVFSDLRFSQNVTSLSGNNIIFDGNIFDWKVSLQYGDGLTFRNSEQTDIAYDSPSDGGEYFDPHGDRLAGLYMADNNGVLIEGNLWDQIGWADGFTYDGEASAGQAPSKYSHNVYLQNNTLDVTFRDNITMQAASFGAVMRGGGFAEDNVFLDNNGSLSSEAGDYLGAGTIGNYSLITDNLITSAGYKEAVQTGAKSWGMQILGNDTTLSGNIVTHLANPDDPDDLPGKIYNDGAIRGTSEFHFNDTIVYNWTASDPGTGKGAGDANVAGLDTEVLDRTTIQRFAAELLDDDAATIADLGDYLRDNTLSDTAGMSDADLIIAYFQDGFDVPADVRPETGTLRFTPNDLGDGTRWDNRLNWDTDDLPGTFAADNVDLAGNWVEYGGTTRIKDLDFGSGGKLNVTHGKLTIGGETTAGEDGGTFSVDNSGQVWMNGYDDEDRLALTVDGGRFANTGHVSGQTQTTVTDGQTLLAAGEGQFDVAASSSLDISGSAASVGFDGDDNSIGTLRFAQGSELGFRADEEGFSTIEEFRSGAFDAEESNIQSGINLGLSTLKLDVSALATDTSEYTLIEVDELIGEFEEIHLTGLADTQDAEVVIDYTTDTINLRLMEQGSGAGRLSLSTIGSSQDTSSSAELWAALTQGQGVYEDDAETELSWTETSWTPETILSDGF